MEDVWFLCYQERITIAFFVKKLHHKGRNSCLSWCQVLSFVNPQMCVINQISQDFYEESMPYNVHTPQDRA